MSIPAPDEISMEDPLCDSSLGSMVTLDYVTPLTERLCRSPSKPQFILERIIWRIYMLPKNQSQRTMKQSFDVTKKLVKDQKEIQVVSIINWQEYSCKRTTLLIDRPVRLSTAEAYVFFDSVLCMGRILNTPVSAWKEKIRWFMNSSQCVESWIESTGSRWSSSGQISHNSLPCRFSPRSRT